MHLRILRSLKIPLPPLPTQKKIAAILDEADRLRQLNQQVLDKYDALGQSLFLEMFGDPVVNPKGWEKASIKKLGTVTTGNTPPRNNDENYGNFIEWIKTTNVNTPNIYLTLAEEYLSEEGLTLGRYVESGAILVTCIAGSRKVIGNVAIANRKVAFNQQINAFTPENGSPLFWYFHFKVSKRYVQSFSTNSMKGMISKGKFEQMEFICPPSDIQKQFEEAAKSIETQKSQAQAALKKSEELFNGLLQRAFKGELVK